MNKKITTIILAAGEGKNIWPYNYKGKMSNTICGLSFVEKAIKNIKEISDDIHVIYNEKNAASIKELISDKNIHLHKIEKESQLLSLQEWAKNNKSKNDFIIYEASSYFPSSSSIKKIISDKKVSLIIKNESDKAKLQTGISFNKKSKQIFLNARSHYVDSKVAGIYYFKNDLFKYIKHGNSDFSNLSIGVPPSNEGLVVNSINQMINETNDVHIVEDKEWVNIKYPWNIAEAFFMEMNGKEFINKESNIEDGAKIGKGCVISKNVYIDSKSIIGDGCFIGEGAQVTNGAIIRSNSHIGANTKIGYNADVEGFIMENNAIVHYGEINAMLGKGCDIGAGTFIGALKFNDKNPLFKIEKLKFSGDTIYPCFIGNHVRTGVGTLTLPGVIIGNESAISPGAIVKENIEDNKLLIVEQKATYKSIEWGSDKFGGN